MVALIQFVLHPIYLSNIWVDGIGPVCSLWHTVITVQWLFRSTHALALRRRFYACFNIVFSMEYSENVSAHKKTAKKRFDYFLINSLSVISSRASESSFCIVAIHNVPAETGETSTMKLCIITQFHKMRVSFCETGSWQQGRSRRQHTSNLVATRTVLDGKGIK